MRRLILVALAACSSVEPDEECPQIPRSDIEHSADVIASGTDQIAIVWLRSDEQTRSAETHASIVTADGTIGPDIALPSPAPSGVTGRTTALWSTGEPCDRPLPFSLVLQQRDGAVAFIDLAAETTGRATVFDGTQYHVFWTTDGYVNHLAIAEDGTRGTMHVLGLQGTCIDAASDGAGTTFVRIDHQGYIVDTATGGLRTVLTVPPPIPVFGQTFYFAGRFHVVVDHRLLSVDSTGDLVDHFLFGNLEGAREFYPAGDTLFVKRFSDLIEVDASLATLRVISVAVLPIGAIGGDLIYTRDTSLDLSTMEPGRIDLIRENAWTKELAVDSPIRNVDACDAR